MSKARNLVQKDLQRDEVAESIQNTVDTIRQNRNKLITILVLILVGVILVTAVRSHNMRVLDESNRLMGTALDRYAELQRASEAAPRKDALTAIITSTDTLMDSYAGTKLAREALYLRGSAYYSMDKFTEAQKAYQAYLDQAKNPEEHARGEIALAYTYENESYLDKTKSRDTNVDNALNHFGSAAVAAKGDGATPAYPYLYYYALLGQARIFELKGKDAEAIKIYSQILKDRPAPVAAAQNAKNDLAESEAMMKMVNEQIANQEAQLSFQATAKLRLERLQATTSTSAPATTATAKQAEAPAAQQPAKK